MTSLPSESRTRESAPHSSRMGVTELDLATRALVDARPLTRRAMLGKMLSAGTVDVGAVAIGKVSAAGAQDAGACTKYSTTTVLNLRSVPARRTR